MDCECAVVESLITGLLGFKNQIKSKSDKIYRMGSEAFMHGGWKLQQKAV